MVRDGMGVERKRTLMKGGKVISTRTRYAEMLDEESEEESLLRSIIERIASISERLVNDLGYQEWMERYEKALRSSIPVIVLHFNVKDYQPLVIHMAYEVKKTPFLVFHATGPFKKFFYPRTPTPEEASYSLDLVQYVQNNLPRGSANILVLDFDAIKESQRILSYFQAFTTTGYVEGNKLVILAQALEDVPAEFTASGIVIELPYPDFKARLKLAKKFIEELEKGGLKYRGSADQLAFFLGGLSYRGIFEVASAVKARAEYEGTTVVTVRHVAQEKRERTEALRVYLDLVEPDFKWRWYKNSLIKKVFERDIILPIERFAEAASFGSRPTNGILLMGPPGTGKTVAVKALSERLRYVPVFELSLPKIMSSLLGETNKRFHMALRNAANSAPCIVFIDEIDTVFQKREMGSSVGGQSDVMQQLQGDLFRFMENEGRKKTVIIIAATNRPQLLDEALISRFQIRLPVLIPKSPREREEILSSLLQIKVEKGAKLDDSVWDAVKELSQKLEWYSPRDFRNIVNVAANNALRRYLIEGGPDAITAQDLLNAAEEIKPPLRDTLIEDEKVSLRYATHK